MIKLGDKVYHWATSNKIGQVIFVVKESSNLMTTGGTMESKTYMIVEYPDKSRDKILSSELNKYFD